MSVLVTLDEAKVQLHITDPVYDPEVTTKLGQANAIVLDYLGARADPDWTETTAPPVVKAAIERWVVYLWEHRGDDLAPDGHEEAIWRDTELLLKRLRDPALA